MGQTRTCPKRREEKKEKKSLAIFRRSRKFFKKFEEILKYIKVRYIYRFKKINNKVVE